MTLSVTYVIPFPVTYKDCIRDVREYWLRMDTRFGRIMICGGPDSRTIRLRSVFKYPDKVPATSCFLPLSQSEMECSDCDRVFNSAKALHAHCRDRADHAYCDDCERLFVHFEALNQVSKHRRIPGGCVDVLSTAPSRFSTS